MIPGTLDRGPQKLVCQDVLETELTHCQYLLLGWMQKMVLKTNFGLALRPCVLKALTLVQMPVLL